VGEPPIDDTTICPQCDGSGVGVADTKCSFCGGCGGVSHAAAQALLSVWREYPPTPSHKDISHEP
jgi:DnaJ-class molecular chaperone